MAAETFTVQGHTVHLESVADAAVSSFTVDGREVQIEYDADAKTYSTTALPYRTFDSLLELAESLIENHPDYRARRNHG